MSKISVFPNLEAELKRNGITYSKLAELLNVPVPSISSRMHGKTKFTLDEILLIINTLGGLDIKYLFEKRI